MSSTMPSLTVILNQKAQGWDVNTRIRLSGKTGYAQHRVKICPDAINIIGSEIVRSVREQSREHVGQIVHGFKVIRN